MSQKLKQDISMGANLKLLRKRARLSQEQVAASLELMGLSVSREVLSQTERGQYSVRISVLLALKELYHIESFDAFFQDLKLR
ncbi:helix-turn-helix transcriptional regulator [Oscillibacter sp.]|uniref:helix-turn-helix transcriptional regulator n=1 Tax=Oscillibacter sp. TaxID=1945593 RepID=UPI0028A9F786|nr:helix-turn-helix transcriptional regulator [Oscillibacter sp.]